MTPQERYQRDPMFHHLVKLLYSHLVNCQMTATEIREAAILAAQMYEANHARYIFPVFGDAPAIRETTDSKD